MARYQEGGSDWGSWLLIAVMLAVFWPVGLFLLIAKLFGKDTKRIREVPLEPGGNPDPGRENIRQDGRVSPVQRMARSPKPKKSNARKLKIFGAILMLFGAIGCQGLLSDLIRCLSTRDLWYFIRYYLVDGFPAIGMLAGGVAMLAGGISMGEALKRYKRYLSVMGDREAMDVEELARTLGYSSGLVEKDLQKMIDKGYFGGRAYLNVELGYLFRSVRADMDVKQKMREEADRKARERAAAAEAAKESVDTGDAGILRKIHQANEQIDDPVLSARIDRLETVTEKIFQAAEKDPKKREKIGTFLNYYLPTTLKLLDSYIQFDSVGMEGENLRQAKQKISDTMETIVQGFEHQLDALYQADAMDVSADIDVMETMLHRDTATAEEDFPLQ